MGRPRPGIQADNFPNLLRAADSALERGLRTAAITGFEDGALCAMAKLSKRCPTDPKDYEALEELHLAVQHTLISLLLAGLCRVASIVGENSGHRFVQFLAVCKGCPTVRTSVVAGLGNRQNFRRWQWQYNSSDKTFRLQPSNEGRGMLPR